MRHAHGRWTGATRRWVAFVSSAFVIVGGLWVINAPAAVSAAALPTVSVGYADSATGIQPWGAIPGVQASTVTDFIGGQPACCATHGPNNGNPGYDGGAIQINNTTGSPITVNSMTVDIGTGIDTPGPGVTASHFDLWGSRNASGVSLPLTLQPGQTVVMAQDGPTNAAYNFDTSDSLGEACDPNNGSVPIVHVTINGSDTDYYDSHQIIDSDGTDLASCPLDSSEQHNFTVLQPGSQGQPPAVPVNDVAPVIEGAPPVQSRSLTMSPGAWNASPPPTLSYQWQRCSTGTCATISGATALQYTPTAADVGSTLRAAVTGANASGNLTVDSAQTATVSSGPTLEQVGNLDTGFTAEQETSNEVYGSIYQASDSGTTNDFKFYARGAGASQQFTPLLYSVVNGQPGTVLAKGAPVTVPRATDGNWYQSALPNFNVTAGTSYFLALAFGPNTVGSYVGYDNGGSGFVASASYSPAIGASFGTHSTQNANWAFYLDVTPTVLGPPKNTAPPAVSGNPYIGSVLAANTGSWTGTTPLTYTYQWQRCDANGNSCSAITTSTAPTYTVATGDSGDTLNVVVQASNSQGNVPATSAATTVVTTPPAVVTIGNTAVGSASSAATAGYKFGSIFTTSTAGTSNDFRFYTQGGSSAQSFVPLVYTVTGNQPAALVGSGSPVTVAARQPAGWETAALTGVALNANTSYLIGLLSGPTGAQAANFYTTASNAGYWNANAYPTPSSSWGGINTENRSWNFALDYSPAAAPSPTPPANTVAPSISGSPSVGSILTANNGNWTGSTPLTYTYQWQRCDANGNNCAPITGAMASTYTLAAADSGNTIEVNVTATNTVNNAAATSAPTPIITTPSTVTLGNTTVGTTSSLTGSGVKYGSIETAAAAGTANDFRFYARGGSSPQSFVPVIYTVSNNQPAALLGRGSPVTVAANQAAGWVTAPLPGLTLAANTSYFIGVLAGPNTTQTAVFYTAAPNSAYWNANNGGYPTPSTAWGSINITNQSWNFAIDYTPTAPPPPTAPANTMAPTISGTPSIGSMLTANNGTWTGTTPIAYTYQWQRCDSDGANCAAITSATASTSTVATADNGNTIRVTVTATNTINNTAATSAATSVVTTPPAVMTIGNTTVGTASGVPATGYKFGTIFTTVTGGTTSDFRFSTQGGASAQSFVPFIYTVTNNQPAVLVGAGPAVTIAARQPAGWVTTPLTGLTLKANTSYLIGLLSGPTTSESANFYTTATNAGLWNANTGGYPGPTASWGSVNTENRSWNFAVDYTPTS